MMVKLTGVRKRINPLEYVLARQLRGLPAGVLVPHGPAGSDSPGCNV